MGAKKANVNVVGTFRFRGGQESQLRFKNLLLVV